MEVIEAESETSQNCPCPIGDKGDTANIGLIALRDEFYPILVREVTSERVKEHFKGICKGSVERFELPNLGA